MLETTLLPSFTLYQAVLPETISVHKKYQLCLICSTVSVTGVDLTNATVAQSNDDALAKVMADPNAISYVAYEYLVLYISLAFSNF